MNKHTRKVIHFDFHSLMHGKILVYSSFFFLKTYSIHIDFSIFAHICSNGTIFLLKILVWYFTKSHSMFAESIHSVADTVNQIILAFGLHKSAKVSIQHISI